MRIAVIGATGRTGRQVVDQALARGHRVLAVARRPEAITQRPGEFDRAGADVLDGAQLTEALPGCDAVISTLGVGASRAPTDLYSRGTVNELQAMATHAIGVLVVVSAAPVGPREEQPPFDRRVIMPILDRLFGATYADMRRMESILEASAVDWVALRPPRLVDKPATGAYRVNAKPIPRSRSITYPDLAAALLDAVGRADLHRRAVYVAN